MPNLLSNKVSLTPNTPSAQIQADRAKIRKSVQGLLDLLNAQGFVEQQTDTKETSDFATHNHQVYLRGTQQIDTDGTIALNDLHNGEARAIEKAKGLMLDARAERDDEMLYGKGATQVTGNSQQDVGVDDDMSMLEGVTVALQDRTARVACAAGASEEYTAPDGVRDMIPRYAETLLLDFFSVCRDPNNAEIQMLEQACGLPFDFVGDWFTRRRAFTSSQWAPATLFREELSR